MPFHAHYSSLLQASPSEARGPPGQPLTWPGVLISPCPGLPTPAPSPQGDPANPQPGNQGSRVNPLPTSPLSPLPCGPDPLYIPTPFSACHTPPHPSAPGSLPPAWSPVRGALGTPKPLQPVGGPPRLQAPAGAKPSSPARQPRPESPVGSPPP